MRSDELAVWTANFRRVLAAKLAGNKLISGGNKVRFAAYAEVGAKRVIDSFLVPPTTVKCTDDRYPNNGLFFALANGASGYDIIFSKSGRYEEREVRALVEILNQSIEVAGDPEKLAAFDSSQVRAPRR